MKINPDEQTRVVIQQLLRLLNKFGRIEKMPIVLDNGVELTTKEIHTIQAIGEAENINVTDVGVHFGVTKGAASQMVSRLVERGFVTKSMSAHSNKEYELSLTDLGWKAFKAHERFHGQDMDELIAQIGSYKQERIHDFEEMLGRVEGIMDRRLGK
jgi:DNA-binding MarR family transcriptional regulator